VQAGQFAVSHIPRVVVVGDGAGEVKIMPAVGYGRVAEFVRVRFGATGAHRVIVIAGHVVEHNVDVNPYAGVVAAAHHLREFLRRARSRVPDVGYRLVAFPPWSVAYGHVFLNWRNLQQFMEILIARPILHDHHRRITVQARDLLSENAASPWGP